MKASCGLLLDHVQPSRCPPVFVQGVQHVLSVLQDPGDEFRLVERQGLVLETLAADCEGVEIGHNRFHQLLGVCDQKPAGVHRVGLVKLVKDDFRLHSVADRMQVKVHVRRLRGAAGLPADDRAEVGPHDVGLSHQSLRDFQAETGGGIVFSHLHVLISLRHFRGHSQKRLPGLLTTWFGLEVNFQSGIGRRLLDHGFVLIVTDLHERHVTGQDTLLGTLPFDIQALSDSIA
mmetsp:Transcript_149712/g.480739  ORF Transcript_149712/g.480739 Transcript_149712/m.480739 type:complete len:232 (+) Transcript_149712:565-1260(+)